MLTDTLQSFSIIILGFAVLLLAIAIIRLKKELNK